METLLKALLHGNLQINAEAMENTSLLSQSLKKSMALQEDLDALLSGREKELLEQLVNVQSDVNAHDTERKFIAGFRLGALLMIELFSGYDDLVLHDRS